VRSSKYSEEEFFFRMKKKPALQALLDRLSDLTEEDIEAAKQPLWIRKILIKLKNNQIDTRTEADKRAEAERIADLMMKRNL
jgi:hypothetical protein